MSSIVKLFKKKAPTKKQQPAEPISVTDEPNGQRMQNGKASRASFRMPLYRKQSPPECANAESCQDCKQQQPVQFPYKSPYSVLTEPKTGRATRSCPGASGTHRKHQNCKKFSPPFGAQSTIHEMSGSYENFDSMAQLGQNSKREERRRVEESPMEGGKAGDFVGEDQPTAGGRIIHRKQIDQQNDGGRAQKQHRNNTSSRFSSVNHFDHHNRCQARYAQPSSSSLHYHHQQQQQPISTSEYGSADPSPISEQQQQQPQFQFSPRQTTAGGSALIQYRFGEAADESSSEDGDNSSDEQEISQAALIQFWQHQTRMLKRELKGCRETAEKYRSKYLRLKSRTDELSMELAKEKERNTWLFNQLIATNEKIAQLSWAQLHNTQQHPSSSTTRNPQVAPVLPPHQNPLQYQFGMTKEKAYKPFAKCNANTNISNNNNIHVADQQSRYRSTAGEVQADLGSLSDVFDDDQLSGGELSTEAQMGGAENKAKQQQVVMQQLMNNHHPQLQQLRTPTPIPQPAVDDVATLNAHFANIFGQQGTPFLNNFSMFQQNLQQHSQMVEVARGSLSLSNRAQNSQTRLLSPSPPRGNDSLDIIEEDEDNESVIGTDSTEEQREEEEEEPIVIPLDAFCKIGDNNKRKVINRAHSSDDLCSMYRDKTKELKDKRKGAGMGSMLLSSSEDDIRMWKKQLRNRGDRVLFRPGRRSLFLGAIGNEKTVQKLFRRFGPPERDALAKFDYLRDERTDVSGLMSSPEKAGTDSKID